MSNNTAEILAELRTDHKNMSLMLDLLERESNKIYAGAEPDYELMTDIMHYMTVYPDAIHHPKEDRLYAEVRLIRPDLSAGFHRITLDHKHIAEQSISVRDTIASITAGNPVRRNVIVADALRYVKTLRSHMQWEEQDLFHRVDEMISDGHEIIEAANNENRPDPVFGPAVDHYFNRVVECVREMSAAS